MNHVLRKMDSCVITVMYCKEGCWVKEQEVEEGYS